MMLMIYILRILLSVVLGAIVGFEREHQDKPAGLRDIILVTVGATLFSVLVFEILRIISELGVDKNIIRFDIGRIFAYVIASIGFLGSGVIISKKNKVEGITTASLLWVMVSTGLLVGIGSYWVAIIATLVLYLILKIKYVNNWWDENHGKKEN